MEKHHFMLLGSDTIKEIADEFGSSKYHSKYWGDIVYTRHYGRNAECYMCIKLGTIEHYRPNQKYPFFPFSRNIIAKCCYFKMDRVFRSNDDFITLKEVEYYNDLKEKAFKNLKALNNVLKKVSASYEY